MWLGPTYTTSSWLKRFGMSVSRNTFSSPRTPKGATTLPIVAHSVSCCFDTALSALSTVFPATYGGLHAHHRHVVEFSWPEQHGLDDLSLCRSRPVPHGVPVPVHYGHCALRAPAR